MAEYASTRSDLDFEQFLESHVGLTYRACLQCGCDDESKIKLVEIDGGELIIKVCQECNASSGLDDATDFSVLRRDFEEYSCSQTNISPCGCCGNQDLDRFVYSRRDERGRDIVQCMGCQEFMELKVFRQDFERRCDFENNERYGGGNDEEEYEGDYGEDYAELKSKDDYEIKLECGKCQNNDVNLLCVTYDPNSKRLIGVKCWPCDNEWSPIRDLEYPAHSDPSVKPCPCQASGHSEDFVPGSGDRNNNDVTCDCVDCVAREKRPRSASHLKRNKSCIPTERPPCRSDDKPGKTLVKSLNMLHPGDHVKWHRSYAVHHHAIVQRVDLRKDQLTVIEYTGGLVKLDGHFARVQLSTVPFKRDKMHRVDYYGHCLSPCDTLQRAGSKVGETQYHPLTNNCEHFATWCKTGTATSGQTETFVNRMLRIAAGSGIKSFEELGTAGAMLVGNNMPLKQALKLAKDAGVRKTQSIGQGATKMSAGSIKGGAVALGIGINLALEAASFAYYSHQAHLRYKDGKISKDDFHSEQMKLGGESLGGFVGGSVGGFLGQTFIPIPILGSIIGCTLGSIVGRFLGAVIGKKVAERVIRARQKRLRQ